MARPQRKWAHCYDLSGTCPICGRAAHVGCSQLTRQMFWLHDNPSDRNLPAHASQTLAHISDEEYESLVGDLGYSPNWS